MSSMIESLKKVFKWRITKSENKNNSSSLLLAGFIGIFEDILFWRKLWLSLSFIIIFNFIFFLCVHRQINLSGFILCLCTTILCTDAIESWLKYKHRTTCLKRLASYNGSKLSSTTTQLKQWIASRWNEFIFLRETNHTKAFILINMIYGMIFLIGKYINGYVLTYVLCMLLCISYKVIYPLLKLFKNIHQNLETESEYEGLIPDVSEVDIKLLSIEPEQSEVVDEKQSFDYWKPEDVPIEEASDSSENSSSLVTNMSMEKMNTLEKDVETSDSSDDEYIPLVQQREPLQSTLEVVEPVNSWSNTAYNTFWNLTGAVANMISTESSSNRRKRVSSIDSSDGFEIIDKNDLT